MEDQPISEEHQKCTLLKVGVKYRGRGDFDVRGEAGWYDTSKIVEESTTAKASNLR